MKVVIWGHKLHTHTHSYIHGAFYKAFEYLGYDTFWFDDNDDVSNFDFSNSIFLTEGQVDKNIPINTSCKYILHNCNMEKYSNVKSIKIQVYAKYVHEFKHKMEKIDHCSYLDNDVLYMPWATDMLPHEIKAYSDYKTDNKNIVWIGTYSHLTQFQNGVQIDEFLNASILDKCVPLIKNYCSISFEENRKLVAESYMSPTIQGPWQVENCYIPCRIFKNISYGSLGITNSKTVSEIFQCDIVYNDDCEKLYYLSKSFLQKSNITKKINDQIIYVRDNHTYINRIKNILKILCQ